MENLTPLTQYMSCAIAAILAPAAGFVYRTFRVSLNGPPRALVPRQELADVRRRECLSLSAVKPIRYTGTDVFDSAHLSLKPTRSHACDSSLSLAR